MVLKAGKTDPAGCEPVAPRSMSYMVVAPVSTIDAADDTSRLGTILATLLAGDPVHLDARHPDKAGDAS